MKVFEKLETFAYRNIIVRLQGKATFDFVYELDLSLQIRRISSKIQLFQYSNYSFKNKHKIRFPSCLQENRNILSGILIYLWPLIPTGNVFNNWLNIIMVLNLPLLIWSRKITKT